ncbi:MAG TPA: MarR family transcriptional regulator, partial [Ignisphaera sp.]|nr:MarR family transcriptional regulator [Ignisphaera sp.]
MDKKLAILKILSEKPDGVPQSTLAKTLRISKSYLSTLLRDLELQGLIYRVRIGNSYIVKVVRPMISTYHRVYQRKKLKLGIVWSSEYLFLASFAKLLKKRLSLDLEIIVYPSALKTTTALIRGEVDAILSPVITQLYAYALAKELIIVGGGASGGAAIYEIKDSKSETVASSELSTMDVCRAMAIHKNIIDTKDTRYFHEPDEALRIAKQKKARYMVVWHPITESLRRIADRELVKCGDF